MKAKKKVLEPPLDMADVWPLYRLLNRYAWENRHGRTKHFVDKFTDFNYWLTQKAREDQTLYMEEVENGMADEVGLAVKEMV